MVRFVEDKTILCEHQFAPHEFRVGQRLALTDFRGAVRDVVVVAIEGMNVKVENFNG